MSITILSSFLSDKRINFHYVSGYFTTCYNGFVEHPENKLSSPQDDILGVKKYNFKTKRSISTLCQIKLRRSLALTVHSSPLPAWLIPAPQHCKWKHTGAKIFAFFYLFVILIFLQTHFSFFARSEIVFVFPKKQFSFNTPHTHTYTHTYTHTLCLR